MIKLIIRELEDRIVYLIIAAAMAVIFCGMIFFGRNIPFGRNTHLDTASMFRLFAVFTGFVMLLGPVIFCGMGAAQIYHDRNKKVFAFLSTLATTRGQIFAAKLIAGIIIIAILFIPTFVMTQIVTTVLMPVAIYSQGSAEGLIALFFVNIAGYSIGLVTGWTNSRIIPTLGGIVLTLVFYTIIPIKGIAPADLLTVVVPFILACWVISWQKFKNASF